MCRTPTESENNANSKRRLIEKKVKANDHLVELDRQFAEADKKATNKLDEYHRDEFMGESMRQMNLMASQDNRSLETSVKEPENSSPIIVINTDPARFEKRTLKGKKIKS